MPRRYSQASFLTLVDSEARLSLDLQHTSSSYTITKQEREKENAITEKKSLRFKIAVAMICLASVLVSMDSVIVAAALPAITVDLGGSSLKAFWVGTSYLLAQTVTVPVYSMLSNIFGRKWVMISAINIFLLGSILCGCAKDMDWLIAARVVQGLGGGGVLPLTTVIISDMTTLRERPKYLSFSACAWALGTSIGVPLGGAIGQFTSWTYIFWINIPLCIIAIAGLVYALQLHLEKSSLQSKLARIDYLGIVVFIASTTALLYGMTTGGVTDPWSSGRVLAPLIIGVAGLSVFTVMEAKVAKHPMIIPRIFSDRTANAGYFLSFVHGLVVWTAVYYLIIFFLGVKRHALFLSSVETLSLVSVVPIAGLVCGAISHRTLRFQKLNILAWILLTTGTGVNALMKPHSNNGVIYGLRVIAGVGAGLAMPLSIFAIQATNKIEDLGVATAMSTFFRSLGQAFGVAIGGTVFQNQFDHFLGGAINIGDIPKGLVTGAEAAGAYDVIGNFPESVVEAYRYVYADALETIWIVTTAIAGLGLLASLLMRNESLDRDAKSVQAFKDDKMGTYNEV